MADYCCTYMHEMNDVSRWLPSEILRDIGIADTAERRRLAFVEDLAARLAGVLSGGSEIAHQRPPSSCQCHRPQVWDNSSATLISRSPRSMPSRPAPPPPYLPLLEATAAPWQVMDGLRTPNGQILQPAFAPQQRLAPPACPFRGTGAQTVTRRSGGTGVFLPRAEAVPRRCNKAAARPSSINEPATRQCPAQRHHRRGDWPAAMARRQQELQLQAMAAVMWQMQQRVDVPATCRELALLQEITY
ncbi:hypothetical protein GUJ93_ZPchr0013g36784 [Zizania palustris]|uniref:Uncharacterized protein n=1 Tax=Zizania palustris TaxID=103762 RepID=A0A8J5X0S8_ZIZPA|nr:hypothetical protein GUJ93_ZPchr0013g36784 [Zizania palustris]